MKKLFFTVIFCGFIFAAVYAPAQNDDYLIEIERIDSVKQVGYNIEIMYPNPVSAIEHCRFTIADTSNVQIILYDIKGNEVANICDDILKPGKYQFLLFNNDKIKINSGIYIVVLEAGTIETIVRRKMKFRSELIVMYIK